MSKRKLTKTQQLRQKKIQQSRIERAKKSKLLSEQDTANSLGAEQPGLLIAHYGTTLIVENQVGQLFRCGLRQNLGTLVTGDHVIWQPIDESTGIVVACNDRKSVLTRPDKYSSKPIAANVDQILIVLALSPLPMQTTLDRYLVLAESLHINPLIIINKCDIPANPSQDFLWQQIPIYEQLGYTCIRVSSKTQEGIVELQERLQGHTSILVGQSGVGKSSLLNTLIPEADARIQALSTRQCLGQHTTTASRLYHLPLGGDIIDSPGIHQFDLDHFSEAAIKNAFREFQPLILQCRFRDCKHQQEPDCALQQAARTGKIASFRLNNFHTLLADRS